MISVMVAIVIIGVSVTAMMTLLASDTKAQAEAIRISTGIRLAQNIHEYSLTLDHTATGLKLLPPSYTTVIDASGEAIKDNPFPGWTQYSQVTPLHEATLEPLTYAISDDDWSWRPKLLVVDVRRNNVVVYSQSWILAPVLH